MHRCIKILVRATSIRKGDNFWACWQSTVPPSPPICLFKTILLEWNKSYNWIDPISLEHPAILHRYSHIPILSHAWIHPSQEPIFPYWRLAEVFMKGISTSLPSTVSNKYIELLNYIDLWNISGRLSHTRSPSPPPPTAVTHEIADHLRMKHDEESDNKFLLTSRVIISPSHPCYVDMKTMW